MMIIHSKFCKNILITFQVILIAYSGQGSGQGTQLSALKVEPEKDILVMIIHKFCNNPFISFHVILITCTELKT